MAFIKPAVVLALALSPTGCGNTVGPVAASPAHGVLITIAVPGRCLVGGCYPVSGDVSTLGLVRVLNTGTSLVYLTTCGPQPALTEQQSMADDALATSAAFDVP
jgi:hypothetical protein